MPFMKRILLQLVAIYFGLYGCATLPKGYERSESFALPAVEGSDLQNEARTILPTPNGEDAILLLGNGINAFAARALLAEQAQTTIDAQYYLLHNDMAGKLFIAKLVQASQRGVRVRLLVDDMDLAGRDLGAASLDALPNFEVRIFNPFSRNINRFTQFLTRFGHVTRRMHNKTFIVDNTFAVVGGRNIGDEYFEAHADVDFLDLDAMCTGDVVQDVSYQFDAYWNSELAYPISVLHTGPPHSTETTLSMALDPLTEAQNQPFLQKVSDSKLMNVPLSTQPFKTGNARAVFDLPEKIADTEGRRELMLSTSIHGDLSNIRKELLLVSPYFVPGRDGVKYFKQLVENNVRVRILTNSLMSNDVPIVHAGYAKYRKNLLRAGVELYELKPADPDRDINFAGLKGSSKASLHAKTFIIDDEKVFVGSLNIDPRSFAQNTEVGLMIDSPDIADELKQGVEKTLETKAYTVRLITDSDGVERLRWDAPGTNSKTYRSDPHSSFIQRFGIGLLGILPIESQL
ncbi:MAG: hypothetical protein CL942_07820 [Desulfovibrio sp.]|nr:hypothetical protein [Desulfovibrio sp.]